MLAIVSDPHGNLQATEAVLADIGRRGISQVRCLGDYTDYGANPNEVIALLKGYPGLRGNHDDYHLGAPALVSPDVQQTIAWTECKLTPGSREFLKGLVPEGFAYCQVGPSNFYLVHGSPRDPLSDYICHFPREAEEGLFDDHFLELFRRTDKAGAIIAGHTHRAFRRQLPDGRFVVNAGSVGQPRDGDPRACYCITDGTWEGTELVRVEYDIGGARQAILQAGLPPFHAERLMDGT